MLYSSELNLSESVDSLCNGAVSGSILKALVKLLSLQVMCLLRGPLDLLTFNFAVASEERRALVPIRADLLCKLLLGRYWSLTQYDNVDTKS